MQMTSYPDIQKESGLPVYTTGVGLYDARNFRRPMQSRERMLMLTTAFGGYDNVMNAYNVALKEGYRFGLYGDAMLIID